MCKGFIKIPRRLFETRWWNQKRVYSESDAIIDLYQSADRKNMMTTTLRTLADRWIWNQMKVSRFLERLQKDGYMSVTKSDVGTIIKIVDFGISVTPSVTPPVTPKDEKCYTETPINKGVDNDGCYTENVTGVTPSVTPSVTPRAYKNDNIISCLQDDKNNKTPLNPPKGTFSKPTIEEVRAYCQEKGYQIDAEQFWNFYESKGWMVGSNHMKNWKACCTTWKKRQQDRSSDDTQLRNNNTGKFKNGFSWK